MAVWGLQSNCGCKLYTDVIMFRSFLLLILISANSIAHEQTPTYGSWSPAHIEGVVKTEIEIFNKRSDVTFFEIGVFTPDWEYMTFVTSYNILEVKQYERKTAVIYMTEANSLGAEYICSVSKIRSSDQTQTALASQICTRLK